MKQRLDADPMLLYRPGTERFVEEHGANAAALLLFLMVRAAQAQRRVVDVSQRSGEFDVGISAEMVMPLLWSAEDNGLLEILETGPVWATVRVSQVLFRGRRESLSTVVREAVLDRDGRTCGICGNSIADDEPIDIDHIRPWSLGGTDELDNLQVSHASCNRRKGARV